jgi:hypothetical protein
VNELLRKGQPFRGIPVDAINAGVEARREQLAGGPYQLPELPASGGGSAGSAVTRCRVYDDLAPGATVRCLPLADGGGDTDAAFIDATPFELGTLSLADTGCCDGGSGAAPAGLRLNNLGRIDSAGGAAVTITGAGARRTRRWRPGSPMERRPRPRRASR